MSIFVLQNKQTMKTKKCRPVIVEMKFNSLEEMNGDLILRENVLYTHSSIDSLKKLEGDMVFELILISLEDEKIEVGDTVYSENLQETDTITAIPKGDLKFWTNGIYKVIATQSQLSPEYISKFVSQYNNGCVEDVEIEMGKVEILKGCDMVASITEECKNHANIVCNTCHKGVFFPSGNSRIIYSIKLTNCFVTIVEKNPILYTEEEVYELFNSFRKDFSLYRGIQILDVQLQGWFERNKKK